MVEVEKSCDILAVGLNAGSFSGSCPKQVKENAPKSSASDNCFIIGVLNKPQFTRKKDFIKALMIINLDP
jgi:hypothetical protein